jgi:hypothetical protein
MKELQKIVWQKWKEEFSHHWLSGIISTGPLDMGRQKQNWEEKPWGHMGYRMNKNK